jgi:uncharacterized DUF497 family protein
VWFEEAQTAFRDPNARLFYDPEQHSEEEDRFILIGVSSTARPLVVSSLLQGIRFSDSDHFRSESNHEGVYIL